MLKKIKKWLGFTPKSKTVVIPRKKHSISRKHISQNAVKVLNRLKKHGYSAYLVGGGVRDLLLDLKPKDFDVATNASPEQIKDVFKNCRLIGRRFRLAHIHFGREIIEVATFRASHETRDQANQGMVLRDNVYGTIEDDAIRRDFTINALYYNIADFTIVDFVGAMEDLKERKIRIIGDPETRYREDPVRMLRAIRFAAKLGFTISKETAKPIHTLGNLLAHVPSARLFEEYLKLFLGGTVCSVFEKLQEYNLLQFLFPDVDALYKNEEQKQAQKLIQLAMQNTDKRIAAGKSVAPGFLIATMLWPIVQTKAKEFEAKGANPFEALLLAADMVLDKQRKVISIPRRFTQMVKDVWELQIRLQRRAGKRAETLYNNPKFRAAYDFLLLRNESGEPGVGKLASWWTDYIEADAKTRTKMAKALTKPRKRK